MTAADALEQLAQTFDACAESAYGTVLRCGVRYARTASAAKCRYEVYKEASSLARRLARAVSP